ncbi:MAG: hypothetical protein RI939_737, partial [Actinomycetota bacterium]
MATHSTLRNDLAERAKNITRRELQRYAESTKGSQAATARARKVMPMG